eukprot:g3892.t1
MAYVLPLSVIWIGLVAFYYVREENWEWIPGMFFSVNIFFSVDFGFPRLESERCKWFTLVHSVLGSTLVCGILVTAFTHFLKSQRRLFISLCCLAYIALGTCFAVYPGNVWLENVEVPASVRRGHLLTATADNEVSVPMPSFADAILYAVTAVTSVAQLSPMPRPFQMIFTSVYIFFGVPLWCSTAGMFGSLLFSHFRRIQNRERAMKRGVTQKALKAMRALKPPERSNDCVDYGSYLEYELSQLRVVDHKLIKVLREKFIATDFSEDDRFNMAVGALDDEPSSDEAEGMVFDSGHQLLQHQVSYFFKNDNDDEESALLPSYLGHEDENPDRAHRRSTAMTL